MYETAGTELVLILQMSRTTQQIESIRFTRNRNYTTTPEGWRVRQVLNLVLQHEQVAIIGRAELFTLRSKFLIIKSDYILKITHFTCITCDV